MSSLSALEIAPAQGHRGVRGGQAAPARTTPRDAARRRPGPPRPAVAVAASCHRGTGVRMSRAPHRRSPARPVTPLTVVGLALLAGVITIWLGVVAQFGETVRGGSAPVPDRLAVVQVRSGETLQNVAARVAPDVPVNSVVQRIRELNELDTAAVSAGQTLIAPVN